MANTKGYGYPVHRNCVNFQNGLCTLSGVAVNPYGAACPRFTPKNTTKTLRSGSALPEAKQPSQMYTSQIRQDISFDRTMGSSRGMGGVRSTDVYPPPMQMQPPGSTARVQEKEALTQQLEELETQLKDIRERLKKFR